MAIIRPEQTSDVYAIRAIHTSSFPSAGEARLVDALRLAGKLSVSFVAEDNGEIIGHVAFSPVSVRFDSNGVGLGPIAVADPHRNHGIAATLVRVGLAACREAGYGWVVVLGEPSYYSRFGFSPAMQWGLSDEYGGGLAFQVIELVAGQLPLNAGVVRYAQEFSQLE
ncbi:MAG: GNAT family N-acetyltransferase [Cyanobium sp.]